MFLVLVSLALLFLTDSGQYLMIYYTDYMFLWKLGKEIIQTRDSLSIFI